jgi:hypothetical protein
MAWKEDAYQEIGSDGEQSLSCYYNEGRHKGKRLSLERATKEIYFE